MSQTVITKAFAEWKAQQAIDNKAVVLDEFVFAFIPGQDANQPIPNTEGLPAADKIVHRQPVSKSGVVNLNAVVYSVVLGTEVGDFDFNWIGLINKATGTVGAITHAPTQRKVKNASGQQGNTLTRSILMEYAGAQTETQITIPAATWQIDFTARLAGMNDDLRLANADIYGAGAFFDTGFLVSKTGTQFFITKGVGYVGGLRAALAANQNITATARPTKVWIDVCFTGTVTSVFQTAIQFTVAPTLADYLTNGVAHYVFALASIDAAGVITDLRPKGSSQYLRKDQNLTDIADPDLALNTLNGVPKIRKVNNKALSDDIALTPGDVGALPSGGTAVAATKLATPRKIAGVDFDGTKDISLTPGDVGALPSSGTAVAATKLATARKIAGVAFDGTKDIAITSGDVGAVQQGGGVGMTSNVVRIGWSTNSGLLAQVDNTPMGAIYCEYNKPTAQDTGALPITGGNVAYVNNAAHYAIKPGTWEGAGGIANQYANPTAPFLIPTYTAPKGVSVYLPLIKGVVQTQDYGYAAAVSVGVLTSGNGDFPKAIIHVIGDNGTQGVWSFSPNNGEFSGPGDIFSGKNILASGGVYESSGAVRVYSPNNKPTPTDINAIGGDTCNVAGFDSGNSQRPYMRNSKSSEIVYLATNNWVNTNFVNRNVGAVGSLAFARINTQNRATGYGEFISGGELSPSGVTGYPGSGGGNWAAITGAGSLAGTWQCLGYCVSDMEVNNRHFGASLFLRIS